MDQENSGDAVIFERPSPEGLIVSKGDWTDGWSGGPLGFFSIGGELLLLKLNTNYLALVDHQDAAKFSATMPDLKPHYFTTQEDSGAKRLVFFDHFVIPKPLEVRIWDYQSGECAIFKFDLFSLFDTSFSGALQPRKMIGVQSEKSAKQ